MSISDEALRVLKHMIGINTESSRSNLDLIEFIAESLEPAGFDIVLTQNEAATKANLFASIGPKNESGLILSGHSDVVPVNLTGWDTDPFKLVHKDNRLYGRGTCDMKGFLAIMVAHAKILRTEDLHRPLHLAISFDEEVGCLGAPIMIENLNPNYAKPRWALIGEPTMLAPVHSHKSITVTESIFRGKAAHSSLPKNGVNAIYYGSQFLQHLNQLSELWANSSVSERRERTYNPGVIEGGQAANIVADFCKLTWDLRQCGADHPEAVMMEVQEVTDKILKKAPIELEIIHRTLVSVSGLSPNKDPDFAKTLLNLTRTKACGHVHYLTEAGLFQRAGIDAIVCGPGSIEQAHQNNEYLDFQQFQHGISLVGEIIQKKCFL